MTSPAGVTATSDSAGSQAGPARSSSISRASGGIWPGGRREANAAAVTARMGHGDRVLIRRETERDVVLGHRSLEHRGALLVRGAAAPECLDGRLRLPALEDVDTPGVHQIRGDGEVEAAGGEAGLFHDAHAVREVGLALLRFDDDMPCDDYHALFLR
jgi:hypothetical protein